MVWYDSATVYHIFPLGYCGAPQTNDYVEKDGAAPILKVLDHLPIIKEQGFTTVFFGPLFQSVGHGYDTVDFYRLDTRLGRNEDLKKVCDTAHSLGLRIVFDTVFNHVGRDFAPFVDVREKRFGSQYKDWFFLHEGNDNYNDGFSYDCWEGYMELVKLNLYNPEVKQYLKDVVTFWHKEFGVDGLRFDVAYCLDLNFLKEIRGHCKQLNPEMWLMGETLHGDYNKWMNPEMLDSVTNYECYKGLFSSFNDLNMFEIAHSLNRQFGKENWCLYTGKNLYSFVDNHDVSRIATQLTDKRHLQGIYTLLFTMPGIPGVYYGSEYGFEAAKTRGSDAVLRPEFDIHSQTQSKLTLLIQKLATLRSESEALAVGGYTQIQLQNRAFAFSRTTPSQSVFVLINADSEPCNFNLGQQHTNYIDALSGETVDIGAQITLEGYMSMVLYCVMTEKRRINNE